MNNPPYLGAKSEIEVTSAWSNPLLSGQIHHSHIETLTAMCAKKFEWEFTREVTLGRRESSNLFMGQGQAAHSAVEGIVTGKININNMGDNVDKIFDQWVAPNITDAKELNSAISDFRKNTSVALYWIAANLDTRILHAEKPFLIPKANNIVPGLEDKWSLAGRIDLIELNTDTREAHIIDMKFRSKSSPQKNLASSQSMMYSMAAAYYGFKPKFTFLEIVKGRPIQQEIKINAGSLEWFQEKIRESVRMMDAGIYPMNVGGWWCSQKYCKFWSECRGKYEPSPDNGN